MIKLIAATLLFVLVGVLAPEPGLATTAPKVLPARNPLGITGHINATNPAFAVGSPVLSLTTSGSCSAKPTIAISPPHGEDGSQALAKGYCVNGKIESYVIFPGGGYKSPTCTVTGGSCSVHLMDGDTRIQTAIDYAFKNGVSPSIVPAVYIPQGRYKVADTIKLPCDIALIGDGPAASVIDLTSTDENGITVVQGVDHPDAWDCRGSIRGMEINASQTSKYTATQLLVFGVSGFSFHDIDIAGGGGRGLVTQAGAERTFAQNIEIDTVRWPLIWMGNENHLIKLNIASPGQAGDGYCYGANCINGVNVAGTSQMPLFTTNKHAAVDFGGADIQISDGSIKQLHNANCFQDVGTFGSEISGFYCEGFPIHGKPVLSHTLSYGDYDPYTTLTTALSGGKQSVIGVADNSWFTNYVNDRSLIYGAGANSPAGNTEVLEPSDFKYGSKAPSNVPGVERGQYEKVWGVFTSQNRFVVLARGLTGSTAPAGTVWPAGSYIASWPAFNGSGYGTLTVAHMHANADDGPSGNWKTDCNDQSPNVCAQYIVGAAVNGIDTFTTGETRALAGQPGVSIFLEQDEQWGLPTKSDEPIGEAFVKSVGRGGDVQKLGSFTQNTFYGSESTNGHLYADGYMNVISSDNSSPFSKYKNLVNGDSFVAENFHGEAGSAITHVFTYPTNSNGPGSPVGAQRGIQFSNSYCFWDTGKTPKAHPLNRWCFVGGPVGSPQFEYDHWNGSQWVTVWKK